MHKKSSVSIVIPAYNEAELIESTLIELCEYMQGLEDDYSWELIIVNDGSTDKTGNIIDRFASEKKNIITTHHKRNWV